MTTWTPFTRRTEDPKLSWIEQHLTDLGIAHRRNGHSRHAPILEVDEARLAEAWALLGQDGLDGRSIDDMPDDHWMFGGSGGEEEEEGKPWVWIMPTSCPACGADLTKIDALVCTYSWGRSGPPASTERVYPDGQMSDSSGHVGEGICAEASCGECGVEVERLDVEGPETF